MSFFKQMHELTNGRRTTVVFHKSKDAEKMKISVSLDTNGKADIPPILMSGTADELDEQFFEAIHKPVTDTETLILNIKDHEDALKKARKDKIESTKSTSSTDYSQARKEKAEKEEKESRDKALKPIEDDLKAQKFGNVLKALRVAKEKYGETEEWKKLENDVKEATGFQTDSNLFS